MELLNQEAEESDLAIFTLGRNAGEGQDRKVDNDFNLSDDEVTLIDRFLKHFIKKEKN